MRLACEVAKVRRSSHYRWLENDPEYREAFELAKQDAADILEAEAFRRAVEGVEAPTGWYMGKPVGYVRRQPRVSQPPHSDRDRAVYHGSVPQLAKLVVA